jgi:hypothetical protein
VAVHAGVPVVVVDPRRPPAVLRCAIPRCDGLGDAGEDEDKGHE